MQRGGIRTFIARAVLLGTFSAGLVGGPGRSARAADEEVQWKLQTNASTTIDTGDTVTWTWADGAPHTVSSVSGPATFDSGMKTGAGSQFSFTFTQAGTYSYRCNIHPSSMTGTVVVETATTTPSPTTTATQEPSPTTTATPTATSTPTATPTATATPTPTSTPTTPLAGARSISLTGAEEVPPVTTTATGTFEWRLDGSDLKWRLKVSGSGLTMAHIHMAAKGANGPVVVTLFPPNQDGVSTIDVAGTVGASNLSGPLAGKQADFLSALRAGELYINVHSKDHPAGAVRGQIPVTPQAPTTGQGLASAGDGAGRTTTVLALLGGALVLAAAAASPIVFRRRIS